MPAVQRVEVWSDVQAAGGTCLKHVAGYTGLTEQVDAITGERTVALTVPGSSLAAPELLINRVLRLQMGMPDPGYECVERRISQRKRSHSRAGLLTTVTARGIIQDLGTRAFVSRTQATGHREYTFAVASLSVTAHVNAFILPALAALGYDWWSLGVVENDQAITSFVYDKDTPLSALRRLADAVGLEFAVRPLFDEDLWEGTGYALDFLQRIGADQPTIQARIGKQLTSLDIEESADDQATVLAGIGATASDGTVATLARARWTVGAIDGTLVTLVDPAGGAGPVGFDDQLNDLALRWPGDAGQRAVQDSILATQQVQLNSVAGLTVGQVVRFVQASDGSEVTELAHPIYRAAYGTRVAILPKPEIPDTVNLVPNGAMRGWHSTPAGWALDGVFPDNWTAGANLSSIEYNTDPLYWKTGGASAKCVLLAGGYLETEPIRWDASLDEPYLAALAQVYVASGVVCIEVCCDPVYTLQAAPLYTYPQDAGYPQVANVGEGNWFLMKFAGVNLLENNLGYLRLRIRALVDSTVYIDAGQLTATAEDREFVEGAAPTRLWQAVNERLEQYAPLATNVTGGYLDLEVIGGGVLQRDVLQPGQQIILTDPVLDEIISTRVLGWSRDWKERLNVSLKLSNRPLELTKLLARGGPPVRPVEPPSGGKPYVPPPFPTPAAVVALVEQSAYTAVMAVVAPDPSVARYRLYRKKNAWPTTSGAPGGDLDSAYFVCERSTRPDGGGVLANGAPCAGGCGEPAYRSRSGAPAEPNESTGWGAGDVCYAIVVPLGEDGSVGTRAYASRTATGSGMAYLSVAEASGSLPGALTLTWSEAGTGFPSNSHVVFDESVDGGPWVEVERILYSEVVVHGLYNRGAGYYPGDATSRLVTWRWRIRVLAVDGTTLLGAISSVPLALRAIKPELV